MDFAQIAALAKNNEKQALAALKETTKYLGIGISNLIIGFNPQAIVVSGMITNVWDLIEKDLYKMSERSVRNGLPKTLILTSSLGESPTLLGALSLVLARKFASAN
jgi:predicted NBD/HSP70 family sugar kinase